MYDFLKLKLLTFEIVGCELADWTNFNYICSEKLNNKEYSYIKKMKAYKNINNFFQNNLRTLSKIDNSKVNNNISIESYKAIVNKVFKK